MIEKRECTGCSACARSCPFDAICMKVDEEGFLYPVVDQALCRHCGICEAVCPVGKENLNREKTVSAYVGYADSEDLRRESSSGGLFSLLAQKVLEKDGVVFGCAMREDCYGAHHIGIDDVSQLSKLRGSKYVQSDVENTFQQVKEALDSGKWVLYSGTPCQIAGMKAFLGQGKYDKLLTVDVICHGVPSPLVWECYIKELELQFNSKVVSVSFRDKEEGWRTYSLSCHFENGAQYRKTIGNDLYLRGFIEDLYLRPSCQNCSMKGDNYWSDLTLGDCWSKEAVGDTGAQSLGISVAVAHTSKGVHMLECLSACHLEAKPATVALKSNPSYFVASDHSIYRNRVIRKIANGRPGNVLRQYCTSTIQGRIRRKLEKIWKSGK